jgi:hypothetical protein
MIHISISYKFVMMYIVRVIFSVSKFCPNDTKIKVSGRQKAGAGGVCQVCPTSVSIQQVTREFVARFTAITWYEYVIHGLVKARTQEDTIPL